MMSNSMKAAGNLICEYQYECCDAFAVFATSRAALPHSRSWRAVRNGLITHWLPLSGQTCVRFSCLSRGPVGPPEYLHKREIFRGQLCRGSDSGYCLSPHWPRKYSHDNGVLHRISSCLEKPVGRANSRLIIARKLARSCVIADKIC